MTTLSSEALAGHWTLVSQVPAGEQHYPDKIEFRLDGCYLASMEDSTFYEWQAGDFEVVDDQIIKIQMSNDAMESYRCQVNDSLATFTRGDGEQVCYQRVPHGGARLDTRR